MKDRTFYYDIETDSKFAPYANITVIGILWDDGEEVIYTSPFSEEETKELKQIFASDCKKVGFNNCNYDDIVLRRHGFPVNEKNRHDGFLAIKTLFPELPAFSLKFLCWWFFGDFYMPEYKMESEMYRRGIYGKKLKFENANEELLIAYNSHDLLCHKKIWDFAEQKIYSDSRHKRAYELDISVGKPVEQMIFDGGLYIDKDFCEREVERLQGERVAAEMKVREITDGRVFNAGSVKQLGVYFNEEGFELEFTDKGNFVVDKSLIRNLKTLHPVANEVSKIREIDASLKYYRNYLAALNDPTYADRGNWIPTSFNISTAKTRRFTSSSKYGLNFQNSSDEAKKAIIIPEGKLGWWMDATQIENIVHIFESIDLARRKAYEADENWSEYVWLCNEILGTNYTKDELEEIESPQNPLWSVYKQYKTVKLMLNFGAGAKKFAETTGFSIAEAKKLFEDIHRACPAIRILQNRVQRDIMIKGEVYDVFGHVYRGKPEIAYKIVAYLIQGCGTGSLPKAQIRACYDTLESWSKKLRRRVGELCVTTHDEIAGYLNLNIGQEALDEILLELNYNMTEKFSPMFDNIPLRSKTYLSTTRVNERKQVKTYSEYVRIR